MPACHVIALTVTLCAAAAYTRTPLPHRTASPHARGSAPARSDTSTGSPVAGPSTWTIEREAEIEPEQPRLDIYGNELADAVARYTFDAWGTAYEEHSPTTEVPHLSQPTT